MDNTKREYEFLYVHKFGGGCKCQYKITFKIIDKKHLQIIWIKNSSAIIYSDDFGYDIELKKLHCCDQFMHRMINTKIPNNGFQLLSLACFEFASECELSKGKKAK